MERGLGVMIFQGAGTAWIKVKKWGNLWHVQETELELRTYLWEQWGRGWKRLTESWGRRGVGASMKSLGAGGTGER